MEEKYFGQTKDYGVFIVRRGKDLYSIRLRSRYDATKGKLLGLFRSHGVVRYHCKNYIQASDWLSEARRREEIIEASIDFLYKTKV